MNIKGVGGSTPDLTIGNKEQINIGQSNDQVRQNNKLNESEVKVKEIKEKDINKALDKLNTFLEDKRTHAEYAVHDKLKDVMIKIVDDETGEVIQELPPKKVLDMVAKMCEMVGLIVDNKA